LRVFGSIEPGGAGDLIGNSECCCCTNELDEIFLLKELELARLGETKSRLFASDHVSFGEFVSVIPLFE